MISGRIICVATALLGVGSPLCAAMFSADTAQASSEYSPDFKAIFTIDGSGLRDGFDQVAKGSDSITGAAQTQDITDAHDTYLRGNHWTTAAGTTPLDAAITWGFDLPVTLGGIHIWNHRSDNIANNSGYEPTRFDLTIFGSQNAVLARFLDVALLPNTPTAQTFSLPAILSDVVAVQFKVRAVEASPDYTGLAEVRFDTTRTADAVPLVAQ